MKLYIYIAASVASVSFAAGYLVALNWRSEKKREKRRETQSNHTNKVETVLLLGTFKSMH
jgi:hypothetical protein